MTDGPQHPHEPRPGGYGYPQQQPGGYGYPQESSQQPSGPAWTPPSDGLGHGNIRGQQRAGEPDWSALADQSESAKKRRRLYMIGGGILAAAVVAGIVATAVLAIDHHNKQAASGSQSSPSTPAQPSPTFSDVTPPPPPNPLAVLSDPKKDTAPLSASGLFFGGQLTMEGRQYTRDATASTSSCSSAAAGALASDLVRNGCQEVLRATYSRNGIAVTVGVAVFDGKSAAGSAKAQFQSGNILPMSGGGVGNFCHGVACSLTANAVGRYAYFTTTGYTDGSAVTAGDSKAPQAGTDIADYAFNRIVQRGSDEAASTGG